MFESITVVNNSNHTIELVTEQDMMVDATDKNKKITIQPKEAFVIFTKNVRSILWEKCRG
jgi:hypothetical protein